MSSWTLESATKKTRMMKSRMEVTQVPHHIKKFILCFCRMRHVIKITSIALLIINSIAFAKPSNSNWFVRLSLPTVQQELKMCELAES